MEAILIETSNNFVTNGDLNLYFATCGVNVLSRSNLSICTLLQSRDSHELRCGSNNYWNLEQRERMIYSDCVRCECVNVKCGRLIARCSWKTGNVLVGVMYQPTLFSSKWSVSLGEINKYVLVTLR